MIARTINDIYIFFSTLFLPLGMERNTANLGLTVFFRPFTHAGWCTEEKKKTGPNLKNTKNFRKIIAYGIGHGYESV